MSDGVTIALIGVGGAILGSLSTIAGQILLQLMQLRSAERADRGRKRILASMLNHPDYPWRSLDRLRTVIGADELTTKRLLLEIGARAAENDANLWGLLARNPFGYDAPEEG
ncbi:MAG: hypothetical protein ACF8PN_04770 [Phycisphaerales bacterium]